MALPENPAIAVPADAEAYCVKCKATRKVTQGEIVTVKNGKPALKGKCEVCGTTMMKFLPKKKEEGDRPGAAKSVAPAENPAGGVEAVSPSDPAL